MECAGWLLIRFGALEVLRTLWALPTTVLPVLPSLRDRLSNRWKDLLYFGCVCRVEPKLLSA